MKKTLGLDLGSKTLGIALSDPLKIVANSYENFEFTEDEYELAIERILEILSAESIDEIVLGLPKNMDNSLGHRAEITLEFKEKLAERTSVPIIFEDERRTTIQARDILIEAGVSRAKRKKHIDKLAATFILQNYLDRRN